MCSWLWFFVENLCLRNGFLLDSKWYFVRKTWYSVGLFRSWSGFLLEKFGFSSNFCGTLLEIVGELPTKNYFQKWRSNQIHCTRLEMSTVLLILYRKPLFLHTFLDWNLLSVVLLGTCGPKFSSAPKPCWLEAQKDTFVTNLSYFYSKQVIPKRCL